MNEICQLYNLVESDENLDVVCKLLKKGHDPNVRDNSGKTLLLQAVQSKRDNLNVVKELIKAGDNVNLADIYGLTPLHYAVLRRKRNVVDELINSGANINAKSCLKRTALHFAISNRQYNKRKRTSLSLNSKHDIWIVKKLLSQENLRINKCDIRGDTPLMWAVKHKQLDTVLLLLEKGANPSVRNEVHATPLHIALSDPNANFSIVANLLLNRACLKCKNRNGRTPIGILIKSVRNKQSFNVACSCLNIVALCYKITKSLKRKIKRIPRLWIYLRNCCAEVEIMRNDVITEHVTMFDFAMKCFNESDLNDQFYKLIVDRVLFGPYLNYSYHILLRVPKSILFEILEMAVSEYRKDISKAINIERKLSVKNCRKVSDEKGFKELPDTKNCEEMPDTKNCMEMSDAKGKPKINFAEFLFKNLNWLPQKYFSKLDAFHLIAAFSKVNWPLPLKKS